MGQLNELNIALNIFLFIIIYFCNEYIYPLISYAVRINYVMFWGRMMHVNRILFAQMLKHKNIKIDLL